MRSMMAAKDRCPGWMKLAKRGQSRIDEFIGMTFVKASQIKPAVTAVTAGATKRSHTWGVNNLADE